MIDSRASPTVFSIAGTEPFLQTLYEGLAGGTVIRGWQPREPMDWADLTVFLPTRRAGRAFRDMFVERAAAGAAILPRIRPIGDVEEDVLDLFAGEAELDVPPAISGFDRQLVLTRLVLSWSRALGRQPDPASPVRVPASPADASWLARDLAALMDQMATEEVDWAGLGSLVPDEYAAYWQLTLAFLGIATEHWPAYLAERGLLPPAERRSLLIDREAARLAASQAGGPVVAAGSTGSIPATARLLTTIARLDRGAVVLPGLPQTVDDDTWRAIGAPGDADAAPSHPLFGLRHLIEEIGIDRQQIIRLRSAAVPAEATRPSSIHEVFRPAAITELWQRSTDQQAAARDLANVSLVEAPDDHAEASAIALVLREFLETGSGRAALITPDRRLARRVSQALRRWSIEIDDSAGEPLARTPAGVLMRLIAEAVVSGLDAIALLSLLKHPLARLGRGPGFVRGAARALEIGVLRGPPAAPGIAGLGSAIAAARQAAAEDHRHGPRHRRYLTDQQWRDAESLFELVAAALSPLEAAFDADREPPFSTILDLHAAALQAIVGDEHGAADWFFARADGGVLMTALAGLMTASEASIPLAARAYPDFLDSLITAIPVRPQRPGHPRLQIWGPLEARLQSPDLTVLGGLNEGVWPAIPQTDPWLSRPMRSALGLQPPERRIGLSAHDFMQGLSGPRVVLTRSERSDGAPTVPSRWLQRLRPVVGAKGFEALSARGAAVLDWVRKLDRPTGAGTPARRPNPRPAPALRPKGLSVTEVETLIRDPYAHYARRVLRLEPIEPIASLPGFSDRGILVHDILGAFVADWSGPFDGGARAALLAQASRHFTALDPFPAVKALWWARFVIMADQFIAWEGSREGAIARRHAEIAGSAEIVLGDRRLTLTGRADRIDLRVDGTADIIDFKTGSVPSPKQVNAGFAPQLPLEAAILARGGFPAVAGTPPVGRMSYVRLRPAQDGLPEHSAVPKDCDPAEAAQRAWTSLESLLARYQDPAQGYLSRAYPLRAADHTGPYDHLARVGEWSLADSGDEQ